MYVIRVRPGGTVLEATLSDGVDSAEALRAVSQALALAEAGGITRILADVTGMTDGPDPVVLAAALGKRLDAPMRLAVTCTAGQLAHARRVANLAGAGSNLGVFTRGEDAEAWLASNPGKRVPQTNALHFEAAEPAVRPETQDGRRASA